MIKVIEEPITSGTILMGDMEPLQVGYIAHKDSANVHNGKLVVRTASLDNFEVMELSNASEGRCWTSKCTGLEVRLLGKGETVTLELSND